jgi:hypothetical protein
MDVQDRVRERVEKRAADLAHETGETDQPNVVPAQLLHHGAIEIIARGPAAVIDDPGGDLRPPRTLEREGAVDVGNHYSDLRSAELIARSRVDERLQIAPAAGNQNADARSVAECHLSRTLGSGVVAPASSRADTISGTALAEPNACRDDGGIR